MTPYHESDGVTLYHGDCLQVLRTLPAESVDAIVTDPPYGLSFMGKRWDYDVPSVEIWAECLRVLKPGGHLLAFAGTRTQHRMAVRIEDAGFEIRDLIAWVYGSGFPKSLDVSKAIDKAAGVEGTFGAPKSEAHAGWIDRGRMRGEEGHEGYQRPWMGDPEAVDKNARQYIGGTEAAQQWAGWGTALKPALEPITVARKPLIGTVAANVLLHGTGAINVDGCRVGYASDADKSAALAGDAFKRKDTGDRGWSRPWMEDAERIARMNQEAKERAQAGRWPANLIHDGSDEVTDLLGEAARFFYCAKAGKKDRGESNKHPTVKPTALMRYLCKLITPPGGLILDPFTGSGSTGRGAVLEGFRFVGMELDAEHVEEAKRRILEVQDGWTDEPEDEPAEDLPGQRLLF